MLSRASFVLVAALLAQPALSFSSRSCSAGYGITSGGICYPCSDGYWKAAGTYTSASACNACSAGTSNNSDHSGCETCPDGYITSSSGKACSPCDAGKQSNSAHTSCSNCPANTASTGGTMCQQCPAGTQIKTNQKGCDKCQAGKYNDTAGQQCKSCPGGTFTSATGSKSCCSCCAGWYSTSSSGSSSCTRCPTMGPGKKPYSAVGSDSSTDCKASQNPGNLPNYTDSCGMNVDNVCPNPTGGEPTTSPITRRKRDMVCTKGFTSCPRFSGRGGFDCVDTTNDPESCGGCVGLDGEGSGTDCTAIKGVSVTRCAQGSCVVDSCRKGWVKSIDGTSCVLVSRTTGSGSESTGLYTQDTETKKRRSSAKRAIRANIY